MAFCASCGSQVADNAPVCPNCGKAVAAGTSGAATTSTAGGMADNVAGMLAYITFIPAIIFLVMEPYNRSRFVRFHSFQSIFFAVAWTVLWVALSMVGFMPVLGWVTLLIWPLLAIGGLIVWIMLLLKANQGQMWKLPLIGDMAEKQANAS